MGLIALGFFGGEIAGGIVGQVFAAPFHGNTQIVGFVGLLGILGGLYLARQQWLKLKASDAERLAAWDRLWTCDRCGHTGPQAEFGIGTGSSAVVNDEVGDIGRKVNL